MAATAVGLSIAVFVPLLIAVVAEPVSRLRAWEEYRRGVDQYNQPGWQEAPETFFRSYHATADNPIEYRLWTNVTRTIPQLDGRWARRTNAAGVYLNGGWHLVSEQGLPMRYLVHRFVPDDPDEPAFGGRWEGLVSGDPEEVRPWLVDRLDPRPLPPGVRLATSLTRREVESEDWRLVLDYQCERGDFAAGLHWVLTPSSGYGGLPSANRTWTHRISADGFRGVTGLERAENSTDTRLMFLGDSILFGWGLAEHETLTRVLAARFRQAEARVECLNLGVPGYNSRQQFRLLEEAFPQLQPDAVIVGYCVNDAEPQLSVPYSNPDRYYRHVWLNSWFLERSKKPVWHLMLASYRAVNDGLAHLGIDSEWARDFPIQKLWPRGREHIGRLELLSGWRRGIKPPESRAALKDMKDYCDEQGVPLLLCFLPAFDRPVERYRFGEIHRDVARWARDLDIPYVDLLPAFSGEADWKSLRVWERDGHPSAKAVRVYAREMQPSIARAIKGLLESGR